MNATVHRLIRLVAVLSLGSARASGQSLVQPETVPPAIILVQEEGNLRQRAALEVRYGPLRARQAAWLQRARDFNGTYVGRNFPEGSREARAGAAESAWLTREAADYGRDVGVFDAEVAGLRLDETARIREMAALAARLPNWTRDEVDRARQVMTRVRLDGDRRVTFNALANTWTAVEARDGDPAFAARAAAGAGPSLSGIGTQSFEDCTIFALAAATGRPYGVVAALAGEMLRDSTARGRADRDDPEGAIKRAGLDTNEIVVLTEALGQAEVVPSGSFARTLREGHAIMVDVALVGDGFRVGHHEVVLSRTFQHEGQAWFEMIDSNLGVNERHYLSEGELFTLLNENGITYRPDPHRTVPLLRP